MSDTSSILPSLSSGKNTKPSFFASSSKQFAGFSSKSCFSDSEASPTSILEAKPFSVLCHHLFAEKNYRKSHWSIHDSKPVGLGIIDALTNDNSEKQSLNSICTTVVFGSKLKIHVPQIESSSTSPDSPIEFGIKNRDSKLALHSPAGLSADASPRTPGILSHKEMELSEDYTCVISHGPNPKKTHIFDNCIMENCGDCFVPCILKDNSLLSDHQSSDFSSVDFLSSCHSCKKTLEQGKDIFMYKGEIAFCSHECRQQEMMSDERTDNCFGDLLYMPL